jgi:hypothetical protein
VPVTGQRTDDGSAAEQSDNLYCGGGYPGPVEHPWAFNPGNFSKWCHLQQKSEMFDKARKAALSEERKLALFAPKKVTTETVKIQIGFIRKYSASIVLSGP